MTGKNDAGASGWIDPDDAPELTDEDFARGDVYQAGQLVRRGRGRPKAAETREQIAIRVERSLLEKYRGAGPGWQTRMNVALGLAFEYQAEIADMESSIAAIRSGIVTFHGDNGAGRELRNAQHLDHLERGIAELRRAIDIIAPPVVQD